MRLIPLIACFIASCANGCAGSNPPPEAPPQPPETQLPRGWIGPDANGHGGRPPTAAEKAGSVAFMRKNDRSPLGVNLRFVSYSTTDWPFLNLMKMASPWISRTSEQWDDGRKLDRDANGWVRSLEPGQWAASLVPTVGGGRLILLHEGRGSIALENASRIVEQREGRIVFEAPPHAQVVVNLTATDPKDPIVNVAVVPPEFEKNPEEQLFHPLFLERLAPFSVIRFLEWLHVNGSKVSRWEDRTAPTYAFQSLEGGVAYEYQIALANRLGADIWIPIPHLANDEYVRQLAQLLERELHPERRVYVEWSNEVWNDSPEFTQAQYARAQGLQTSLHSKDGNAARLRYQSVRSVQVFQIFEGVFKDRSRLVRVMASQSGNVWAHEELLDYKNAHKHVDALAIAPYFGNEIGSPDREGWLVRSSTDDVLDHLEKKSLPEVLGWIRDSAKIAKKYQLDLIAYEGGQHLVAHPSIHNNPVVNERLDDVNRHTRMKRLTLRLLQGWREAGGKTFVYYAFAGAPSKWGRFGALEQIDQPLDAANKYDALLQFVEANPRWW